MSSDFDAPSPTYPASVRIRENGLKLLVRALTDGDGFIFLGNPRICLLDDGSLYVEIPSNVGVYGEERKFLGLDFFFDLPEDLKKEAQDAQRKKEPVQEPPPPAADPPVDPGVPSGGGAEADPV